MYFIYADESQIVNGLNLKRFKLTQINDLKGSKNTKIAQTSKIP